MSGEVLDVERHALERRAAEFRAAGSPCIDLLLSIEGRNAAECVNAVLFATPPGDEVSSVYPSRGGAFVLLEDRRALDSYVIALRSYLRERGLRGELTSPPSHIDPALTGGLEQALTLMAAFSMDPPPEEGPFYPSGVLAYRWGVDAATTADVLADALAWASDDRPLGHVEGVRPVPVDARGAKTVLAAQLAEGLQRVPVTFASVNDDIPPRRVEFHYYGQVALSELAPVTEAAVASGIGAIEAFAHTHANQLDYAAMGISSAARPQLTDRPRSFSWFSARSRWLHRIPDVFAVQVLTSAHLDGLPDLSPEWDLRRLTPQRFLLRNRDPYPWMQATATDGEGPVRHYRAFAPALLRDA